MASMVCAVCMDDLVEELVATPEPVVSVPNSAPAPAPTDDNYEEVDPHGDETICALKCGHLFHRGCVKTWFNQKRGHNPHAGPILPQQKIGPCPICKGYSLLPLSLRLYPSFKRESMGTAADGESNEELNALRAANAELAQKLKESQKVNFKQRKVIARLNEAVEAMEAVGASKRLLRSTTPLKSANK